MEVEDDPTVCQLWWIYEGRPDLDTRVCWGVNPVEFSLSPIFSALLVFQEVRLITTTKQLVVKITQRVILSY